MTGADTVPSYPEEFQVMIDVSTPPAPDIPYEANVCVQYCDHFAVVEGMGLLSKRVSLIQQHDIGLVCLKMDDVFVAPRVVGVVFDAHDPMSVETIVLQNDVRPVKRPLEFFEGLSTKGWAYSGEETRKETIFESSDKGLNGAVR